MAISVKVLVMMTAVIGVHLTILRLPCKYYADFSIYLVGLADSASVLKDTTAKTENKCTLECVSVPGCKSVNYRAADGKCQLLERNLSTSVASLSKADGWKYITTDEEERNVGSRCKSLSPCLNGKCIDTCDNSTYKCICDKYYYGKNCDKQIQDCASVYQSGSKNSGIYSIRFSGPETIMNVYCFMGVEDQWIVIQRRVNNSVDFYRDWQQYKKGFGDLNGNFWIGLDRLHMIAGPGKQAYLGNRLKHRRNHLGTYYALYRKFEIGSEAEKYKLSIGEFNGGSAGDSLAIHNGMMFTTYDNENDNSLKYNCAVSDKGAWWYNSCHWSNLNGLYPKDPNTGGKYMSWHTIYGQYGDVTFSQMEVRYP